MSSLEHWMKRAERYRKERNKAVKALRTFAAMVVDDKILTKNEHRKELMDALTAALEVTDSISLEETA